MLPRIANGFGKQYGQGGNRISQLWVRSLCSRSLHDRELMTCSVKAGTIQESYFGNSRRQVGYGLFSAEIPYHVSFKNQLSRGQGFSVNVPLSKYYENMRRLAALSRNGNEKIISDINRKRTHVIHIGWDYYGEIIFFYVKTNVFGSVTITGLHCFLHRSCHKTSFKTSWVVSVIMNAHACKS